ncbi:Male sterility protein [Pseudomonas pohangensis]|uniref:Male sterility protein n=1 Tax=Pseudomonas pohangensis TaxID=364197 RepID=A0A1H2FJZ3_9PSED|nr:SDR family oxidoreductase [Pseudomonas pohangensis]SDU07622.1 Male sterility protein [Pseudomonas pohangensis]
MRKTVTVFGATGVAGSVCVDELLRQQVFNVQVLARKSGQASGVAHTASEMHAQYDVWQQADARIIEADATRHN